MIFASFIGGPQDGKFMAIYGDVPPPEYHFAAIHESVSPFRNTAPKDLETKRIVYVWSRERNAFVYREDK